MLILTRKTGEAFMISDEIEVRIVEISGDKVKVGIDAPRDYRIARKELCQTVENNKEAAASATAPKADLLSFLAKLDQKDQQD